MTNEQITHLERMVVACMIVEPGLIPTAKSAICVSDFISFYYKNLFAGLVELYDCGKMTSDPDVIAAAACVEASVVTDVMKSARKSVIDGFDLFLSGLVDKKKMLALTEMTGEIQSKVVSDDGWDVDGSIQEWSARMSELLISRTEDIPTVADVSKKIDETGEAMCVSTGFPKIDYKLYGGLYAGTSTVIAAGTSIGKSQFAIQMMSQAKIGGKPARCLYICQEMQPDDIYDRLCAIADITVPISLGVCSMIRRGKAPDNVIDKYEYAYGCARKAADKMPIMMHCRSVSAAEIDTLVAQNRKSIDLVVIDYLQQCKSSVAAENEYTKVNQCSWMCKDIAMRQKLPVVVLSQLSRAGTRDNPKPQIADLRSSGQIEQDADNVFLLWRKKEEDAEAEDLEVFVAKNRMGGLTRIVLDYNLKRGYIRDSS